MIVLDTNVISELLSNSPNAKVMNWLSGHKLSDLYLSTPTIMELWSGALRLPIGKRRFELEEKITLISETMFLDRTLILDEEAAKLSGKFVADQFRKGRKPSIVDCQIAAIAFVNKFNVATRDMTDFDHEGLGVVNPWEES
jgi:toxin FitB